MNAIAEKFREVADVLESLDEPYVASVVKSYAEKSEARAEFQGGPDAKLAQVLRESYYDGVAHSLVSSVPEQWLRMAGAARAQVDAERREPAPREWDRVQDVPDGVRFTEQDDIGDSWIKIGDKYQFTDIYGYRSERLWTSSEFYGYGPFREVTE